ncbi:hypothetical protein PV328_000416 [Microctonus aethiopoides]|uniref:Odorant receptor n=1 Tax=Microctonus aethiopoides TaxID=144406 RepID=A0AA39FV72_9HYME|nr:hypothetical protein PV328_000416 [Microctonus aethiopoides]
MYFVQHKNITQEDQEMITKIPCISWEFEYILRIVSLWPNTYNISIGIILWLTWITIVPFQLIHMSEIWDNVVELMTAICDFFTEIALFLKLLIAWINRKILMDLLIEMADDWRESKVKSTRESRLSCFVARLDLYIYCGAIIMFFPKLLIAYFTDNPENREFLLKTSYPFDDYKSPIYETIIILHFVQGVLMTTADLMPQAFIVALVCHSGTQFNILHDKIERFVLIGREYIIAEKEKKLLISEIIKKHQKNIDFAERIEKAFSTISFIHCLCNGVAIGCSGLVFVTTNDPIYIGRFSIYLVMKLVQTFVLCYAGEYLTNKSMAVANVAYESNWYDLNTKHAKILLLIILRAQKPLHLTAGKFAILSSGMFTIVS